MTSPRHVPAFLRQIGREDDDDDDLVMGDVPEEDTTGSDDADADPEEGGQEEEAASSLSQTEQKTVEDRGNMLVTHFLFAVVWSVGGALTAHARLKFDEFFRSLCDMESPNSKYPR